MKKSTTLASLLSSHPFYSNRLDSDKLFAMEKGSVSLGGILDKSIRFIEDFQLMSPELWTRFVNQFRATEPKADDADNGWRGEYWGKMMRGACFTYGYTQNKKLYKILEDTVRDMMSAQDELGRLSSYSIKNEYHGWDIWSRKYILLGMQYFIEICEDEELIKEITDCMCRHADYMLNTLGPASEGKLEITETSNFWNGLNSSSLLEPMVRMYTLTGYQRYLNFATYIISRGGTKGQNIFELAYEGKLYPYQYNITKAYEMMSCFEGLLEYYRVTKIEKWKTAVINFAHLVRKSDVTIIGCSGCTHELFDNSKVRQLTTTYNGVMQETCVTVTWMKFCYQLLCVTGDSVFADEIEKSVYNALIGSINFDRLADNGGLPFDSYSPLLLNTRMRGIGGLKIMSDGNFYGCCACIGSAGTGIIGSCAVMLSHSGVTLNLYSASTIKTKTPSGKKLTLKVKTDYPVGSIVNIAVDSPGNEEFVIALRIPEWSKNSILSINGEDVPVTAGTYAELNHKWSKNDKISLKLDMRCAVVYPDEVYSDENSRYHISLRRGPLVLARDARLPGNVESIVNITPDSEGYVTCTESKSAIFDHLCNYTVALDDGSTIEVVDYASAGRTWNEESMMTAWMPTKNYWALDLSQPLSIASPSSWASGGYFYPVATDNGIISVTSEKQPKLTLEQVKDNTYKIRFEDGKYFALSPDKKLLIADDKGYDFKIVHYAQNRYKIFTEDQAVFGSNDPKKPLSVAPRSFNVAQVFVFSNI